MHAREYFCGPKSVGLNPVIADAPNSSAGRRVGSIFAPIGGHAAGLKELPRFCYEISSCLRSICGG